SVPPTHPVVPAARGGAPPAGRGRGSRQNAAATRATVRFAGGAAFVPVRTLFSRQPTAYPLRAGAAARHRTAPTHAARFAGGFRNAVATDPVPRRSRGANTAICRATPGGHPVSGPVRSEWLAAARRPGTGCVRH